MNVKKLSELIYSNSVKNQVEEFYTLSKLLNLNDDIRNQALNVYDYFYASSDDFMCKNFKENKKSKINHFLKFIFLIEPFENYIDENFYDWFNKHKSNDFNKYSLHKKHRIIINNVKYLGTFYKCFNVYMISYSNDKIFAIVKM